MTTVYSLETGKEHAIYSLPPKRAVVCAHNQSRGDFNTWEYDYSIAVKTKYGYTCGNFWAKE